MRKKMAFFEGKKFLFLALIFAAGVLWAGDTAVFVDLGFSPDGKTYMFGQYGVLAGSLKPWAELAIVDVIANNFVQGGKLSYTHDRPIVAGQDGAGALYRLVSRSAALAERCNISLLLQGQPLYILLDNGKVPLDGEMIEFRDFERGASFRAKLNTSLEGSGDGLVSSFSINLEYRDRAGNARNYTVGNLRIKRGGVSGYRIRKVVTAPENGSLVFIIELKKINASGGFDIRYMVETLRL